MTLQLNVGEVRYAPSRDIAYLFPSVLSSVAAHLEDAPSEDLNELLDGRQVTLDDLGAACEAYCNFINASHQTIERTMWDVLEECGWHDLKPEVRVAYLYYVGAMMTGTFFKGIRDAVPERGATITPIQELLQAAQQFTVYVTMPRWRRALCRWSKRLRRVFLQDKGVVKEM